MSIKLDTKFRGSWNSESQIEIQDVLDQLEHASPKVLIALGISILLDPIPRHRRYTTPQEEGIRLALNRSLQGQL